MLARSWHGRSATDDGDQYVLCAAAEVGPNIRRVKLLFAFGMLALALRSILLFGPSISAPETIENSTDEHRLTLRFGATARGQRDEVFNQTRYVGGLGTFAIGYGHTRGRNTHNVQAVWNVGLGRNRYDRAVLWTDSAVRYHYAHLLAGSRLPLWLGVVAHGGPRLVHYRQEDADHIYWVTHYGVGPRLRMSPWEAGSLVHHRLDVSAELPMLGLASRPPPTVTTANDRPEFGALLARAHAAPFFASLHNTWIARVGAVWSFRGKRKPSLEHRIRYDAEYLRIALPSTVAAWTHTLSYGLAITFGRSEKRMRGGAS